MQRRLLSSPYPRTLVTPLTLHLSPLMPKQEQPEVQAPNWITFWLGNNLDLYKYHQNTTLIANPKLGKAHPEAATTHTHTITAKTQHWLQATNTAPKHTWLRGASINTISQDWDKPQGIEFRNSRLTQCAINSLCTQAFRVMEMPKFELPVPAWLCPSIYTLQYSS